MRCAVCDEPFFRYQGVPTPRGIVCSHFCAADLKHLKAGFVRLVERVLEVDARECGCAVDDDSRNVSRKAGNPG